MGWQMADLKQIANELAEANQADIILINASMERGNEHDHLS